MSSEARELARQLLNRLDGETESPTPADGPTAPHGATVANRSARGRAGTATRPRLPVHRTPNRAARQRSRTLLTDLPQVQQALARDKELNDGLAAVNRPSPYYRCHEGVNGAT